MLASVAVHKPVCGFPDERPDGALKNITTVRSGR